MVLGVAAVGDLIEKSFHGFGIAVVERGFGKRPDRQVGVYGQTQQEQQDAARQVEPWAFPAPAEKQHQNSWQVKRHRRMVAGAEAEDEPRPVKKAQVVAQFP